MRGCKLTAVQATGPTKEDRPKTRVRRTGLRAVLYEGVLQHGTEQATVQSVRKGDSCA